MKNFLHISYDGMLDLIEQSQILPYQEILATKYLSLNEGVKKYNDIHLTI